MDSRSSIGSHVSYSMLPPPISSPNKNCLSAAAKRYKFLKRMIKVRQMDFEFAMWQTLYLFVSPQKVFRDFQYRKQNKAQYARDDPAFLVLLLGWIVVSSAIFSSFLHYHFWQFFVFTLYLITVGCIGLGMVVATGLWFITNRFMIRKECRQQDVEWAYSFDVHLNAFFPPLIILHIFQFIFYHVFYDRLSYNPHSWFFGLLLGNSFWVAALGDRKRMHVLPLHDRPHFPSFLLETHARYSRFLSCASLDTLVEEEIASSRAASVTAVGGGSRQQLFDPFLTPSAVTLMFTLCKSRKFSPSVRFAAMQYMATFVAKHHVSRNAAMWEPMNRRKALIATVICMQLASKMYLDSGGMLTADVVEVLQKYGVDGFSESEARDAETSVALMLEMRLNRPTPFSILEALIVAFEAEKRLDFIPHGIGVFYETALSLLNLAYFCNEEIYEHFVMISNSECKQKWKGVVKHDRLLLAAAVFSAAAWLMKTDSITEKLFDLDQALSKRVHTSLGEINQLREAIFMIVNFIRTMYAEAENLLSSARYFEALHREELDFSDKQPGEVFACLTQNRTCGELISQDKTVYGEIPKCRECVSAQQNGRSSDRLCRFQDFRTFIFRRNVVKPSVGFLKYSYIANPEEFEPWLPTKSALQTSPEKLKLSAGKMLSNVGDCFCRIVREEQEVLDLHSKSCEVQNYKPSVAYKRLPPLVRDICDVCETTLFNLHWICKECGFGVCIDCYKENKADEERDPDDKALLRRRIWPPCTKENPDHCSTDLMLTQLIPGSLLFDMSEAMHALRDELKVPYSCACEEKRFKKPKAEVGPILTNGTAEKEKRISTKIQENYVKKIPNNRRRRGKKAPKKQVNGFHADASDSPGKLPVVFTNGDCPDENCKMEVGAVEDVENVKKDVSAREDIDDVKKKVSAREAIGSVKKEYSAREDLTPGLIPLPEKSLMDAADRRISETLKSSSLQLSGVYPRTFTGIKAFVQEWVNISEEVVKKEYEGIVKLPHNISTEKDFGEEVQDLISFFSKKESNESETKLCKFGQGGTEFCNHRFEGRSELVTSELFPNSPHSYLCNGQMLWLLDGSLDEDVALFTREWRAGQPVIVSNIGKRMDLSLWRPSKFSDDFGEEEHDLVNCLTDKVLVNQPMKKFWDGFDDKKKRMLCGNGLPMLLKLKDWPPGADFADVMPDRFRDVMQALPIPPFTRRDGIMNLASYLPSQFLPPDLGPKMYIAYGSAGNPMLGTTNLHLDISDAVNVMAYVGSSGELQDELKMNVMAYVGSSGELQDELKNAPVIRRFLRKIAAEKGHRVKADSDPIHDQQTYLDDTLRERLREEYGVLGYGFVQCLGDAVFIPAGAPHQVRNLLNCIKVAEDFVSSETLEKCFELTKEFRRLSAAHANREDKLQIKNIVYQSIRQALSTILFVCVFVGIDFGPANMQRTEKHLDAALDAMIQRVTDLKNAIAQVIAKIDVERDTLKWPSLLDSYGLLTGELNSLLKTIKNEKTPLLRNYVSLPLMLNPEKDDALLQLTDNRVPFFNHDSVPCLLRTIPEPGVEQYQQQLESRMNQGNLETLQKQINTMNKICGHVIDSINNHTQERSGGIPAPQQTSNINDTHMLVAAVGIGRGLKVAPMQMQAPDPGPPRIGPPRPMGMMGPGQQDEICGNLISFLVYSPTPSEIVSTRDRKRSKFDETKISAEMS
ncbi:unnamed protein product [Notodromas monacha]|uniref:JmjC domain-containing protein n=1 Tax=Notodromas monacha TaxID=399045 RepID=A0A7R9BIR3_9CRUS|nr:unnamed protein product [Notodromas monacha]CAG0916282.1 unnamed protein product [Notodromas monacha]